MDGLNCDMSHQKILYLLNEQEALETVANNVEKPTDDNTAQRTRDCDTYKNWIKDRSY